MKVLTIYGTRPEAIKLASLIKQLENQEGISSVVCSTGQHMEMSKQVEEVFDIEPQYNLKLMTDMQELPDLFSKILTKVTEIITQEKPDFIFVQGDTLTTLASSIAAYFTKANLCHIEAGLRTNNLYSPWPEEGNRKMTSCIAKIHFCPTKESLANLQKEGYKNENIVVTGNTVIDSLLYVEKKISIEKDLKNSLLKKFNFIDFNKKILLLTYHRRENYGEGFEKISKAIQRIAHENNDCVIVFPVHKNPNVRKVAEEHFGNAKNIFLTEPLPYMDFIFLMMNSHIILSDSGGIQEEAPSLGKPVLVLRDTTERPEAMQSANIKLVGTDIDKIVKECTKLLNDDRYYEERSTKNNPFGDGTASMKIIEYLKKYE